MWSGAWHKRRLTSEISNRFLPSTVSRALDWWPRGCEFKPHWGQFLTKFILCCVSSDLSDNLTEMGQTGLSWKTRLSLWAWYLCHIIIFSFTIILFAVGVSFTFTGSSIPYLFKMLKIRSRSIISTITHRTVKITKIKRHIRKMHIWKGNVQPDTP